MEIKLIRKYMHYWRKLQNIITDIKVDNDYISINKVTLRVTILRIE
jgi:hypothetical protein